MSQRGQFFASLVNYCVYYKNKWLSRGYTTPIMDAVLFAKIRRAVFGDNLRLINVASALFPDHIHNFVRAVADNVLQGYGATEVCPATLQLQGSGKCASVGYGSQYADVVLESWPEGGYTTDDKAGPAGEIIVGGRAVAGGYYGFDDGSFFTDDQGRTLEASFLNLFKAPPWV